MSADHLGRGKPGLQPSVVPLCALLTEREIGCSSGGRSCASSANVSAAPSAQHSNCSATTSKRFRKVRINPLFRPSTVQPQMMRRHFEAQMFSSIKRAARHALKSPAAGDTEDGSKRAPARHEEGRLFQKDVRFHRGCVNAIEFSPGSERFLASGGDDCRIVLWSVNSILTHEKPAPVTIMTRTHLSNIFCLEFDTEVTRLWSAGNDSLIMLHDLETNQLMDVWKADSAIYGVAAHPLDRDIFLSASENGIVELWDVRGGQAQSSDAVVLASGKCAMQSVMFNPVEPRMVAVANAVDPVAIYDIRKPKSPLIRFKLIDKNRGAMCAKWDSQGRRLLVLQRRSTPAIYDATFRLPLATFDQPGYHNSCTLKSGTFAGPNDEYFLSGSDDWKIYCWKVPWKVRAAGDLKVASFSGAVTRVPHAHAVLSGHRSIVNQVRYSGESQLIASGGVEKIIKLWSRWELPGSLQQPSNRNLLSEAQQRVLSTRRVAARLPVVRDDPEDEDAGMLAFFDGLVQRDISYGSDGDDSDSSEDSSTMGNLNGEVYYSEVPSSSSSASSLDNVGIDGRLLHPGSSSSSSSDGREWLPSQRLRARTRSCVETLKSDYSDDGDSAKTGTTGTAKSVTMTELVVRKRKRAEMMAARAARKRGRFPSESTVATSHNGGASSSSVREIVMKGAAAACHNGASRENSNTDNIRQERLKYLRRLVNQNDEETAVMDAQPANSNGDEAAPSTSNQSTAQDEPSVPAVTEASNDSLTIQPVIFLRQRTRGIRRDHHTKSYRERDSSESS